MPIEKVKFKNVEIGERFDWQNFQFVKIKPKPIFDIEGRPYSANQFEKCSVANAKITGPNAEYFTYFPENEKVIIKTDIKF